MRYPLKPRFPIFFFGIAMAVAISSPCAAEYDGYMPIKWAGPYAGFQAGGGFFDAMVGPGSLAPAGTAGTAFSGNGALFAVLGGFSLQKSRTIYGIEGDIAFSSASGNNNAPTVPSLEINSVGTLRGRAGQTFDRLLIFATAGIGFAQVDAFETRQAGRKGSSHTHIGAVFGTGVENAVTANMVVRGEYRIGLVGSQTYDFPESAPHTHDIDLDISMILGTLIWKF